MPVTRAELEDLVKQVRATPGWEVQDHPSRWKITSSLGGGPLFVNHRPPKGNTLKPILDELVQRGWNPTANEAAAEAERLGRIEADRAANERAFREAERKAAEAEIAALKEQIQERDEELLAVRASQALVLPGDVTKEVVDVDADLARELLTYNHFFTPNGELNRDKFTNRPLDPDLVRTYKEAMLRHEWTQSHQGLAFDRELRLIDGQHRLLALMEAEKEEPGITFRTEITYNLDQAAFLVVDSGKKRTVADVYGLRNIPHRFLSASTVKLLHMYYTLPPSKWDKFKITNAQSLDLYDRYDVPEGTLREAVRVGSKLTKIISTPSASAAGYYISKKAYPASDADEFVYGLHSGASLDPGDPRLAYRRFNERLKSQKHRKTSAVEQLALWIKAYNAWIDGTPMHILSWRSNEPFPQPIHQRIPSEVNASDDDA